MAQPKRKFTQAQVARFKAIAASKARAASNDNAPVQVTKSAYVDTTMTPAMLAACVEASGIGA